MTKQFDSYMCVVLKAEDICCRRANRTISRQRYEMFYGK